MTAAAIFRHSRPRRMDEEPWGQAFSFSVFVHAGLLALMLLSEKPPQSAAGPVLTEVNFIEKAIPSPEPSGGGGTPAGGNAVKGLPDSTAQSPMPQPASRVVAFASPAGAPPKADAVAAPIIAGPIVSAGQMGVLGSRKAAVATMASPRDVVPSRRGPVPMPGEGAGTRARGSNIALGTQGVDDIRRGGGGLGVPLSQGMGVGSGGGSGVGAGPGAGKPVANADGMLTKARKAPVEALKANPIEKDVWGKKQSPFSMEGPLKYRKIKTMQMPPYPRWAEERGLEASVSYRLWVDSKGRVKDNMYLENTSGHGELDALAKEALLKFVFVPLPDNAPAEDEWGVATFRFELKK
jgi:TonB family protein